MQEEKQMERRKKIAVELSDLVVYCRPVPFNEDSKNQTLRLQNKAVGLSALVLAHVPSGVYRDRDGARLLPGHVLLPGDEGREVCNPRPREALPAVQPPATVQSLPPRTEAGLVQLRPAARVALRLPAGRAQLPNSRCSFDFTEAAGT